MRAGRVLATAAAATLLAAGAVTAPAQAAPIPTYMDSWCVTGPITYTVSTRGLSSSKARSAVATIKKVMRQYQAITGVRMKYAGKKPPKPLAPNSTYPTPEDSNITFSFAPRNSMATAGRGGGHYRYTSTGQRRFTGGDVRLATYLPGSSTMLDLTIHEVGHVMGLDHSANRSSVMYPIVHPGARLSARERKTLQKMIVDCPADADQPTSTVITDQPAPGTP